MHAAKPEVGAIEIEIEIAIEIDRTQF